MDAPKNHGARSNRLAGDRTLRSLRSPWKRALQPHFCIAVGDRPRRLCLVEAFLQPRPSERHDVVHLAARLEDSSGHCPRKGQVRGDGRGGCPHVEPELRQPARSASSSRVVSAEPEAAPIGACRTGPRPQAPPSKVSKAEPVDANGRRNGSSECPDHSFHVLAVFPVKSMLHEPDDPLMVKIVPGSGSPASRPEFVFSTPLPIRLDHLEYFCPSCALVWVGGNTEVLPSPEAENNAAIFTKLAANICLADVPAVRRDPPGRSVRSPAAPRQVDRRDAQTWRTVVLLQLSRACPA